MREQRALPAHMPCTLSYMLLAARSLIHTPSHAMPARPPAIAIARPLFACLAPVPAVLRRPLVRCSLAFRLPPACSSPAHIVRSFTQDQAYTYSSVRLFVPPYAHYSSFAHYHCLHAHSCHRLRPPAAARHIHTYIHTYWLLLPCHTHWLPY